MRSYFFSLLGAALCCSGLCAESLLAQDAPPVPAQNASVEDEVPALQYPNNPVSDILVLYEKLTGKILIRDANLSTGPNISIVSPKQIPKSEAIRLIEASLLLNGYSLVPDNENHVKIVYEPQPGKSPRSEGVPLYDNPTAIPPGNQVVSYFMPLRFMSSTDALAIFKDHVVLHSYGEMIEVPNAHALVITENAPLIRELIELQELVDVPPARVDSEFITLKHADAERVAETITKMIDAEKGDKQKHGENLVSGSVQLVPDTRTNRILVVLSRAADLPYIKNLIGEFDEEVGSSAPLERPLKYVSAAEVLPVLADLLRENEGGGREGQTAGSTGAAVPASQPQQQAYQGQSSENSNGAASGPGANNEPPDLLKEPDAMAPTFETVGKTHLIADNKANSILVIGPPESQQKVREILDDLDKRPPQVYLSTVIGQLQLKNNDETGVDYLKLFQSAGSPSGNNNGFAGSIMNTGNALITPQNLTAAAAFPATGGLSLYGTIGKNVSAYVHALESTNRFKVLARPVVYTANNHKATISSGQRVPYPSSTLSSLTTTGTSSTGIQSNIDYEDVVLKLEVIPLINANNEVNLKIAQVNDSIAGTATISGNTVPTISTQKITTNVTVPNGDTVVLGGLITESTTTNLTGIPILMHLPWIGQIFRDTVKNKERDELIIFIQPNVVNTDTDLAVASEGEKVRADTGKDAYDFTQPALLPSTEMDSFFPKDSKGTDK